MVRSEAIKPLSSIRFSVISLFILLGLLRISGFNFYLAQLLGMPVEINHLGGGAFNFINYIATSSLLLCIALTWQRLYTKWSSILPFVLLGAIYITNNILTAYSNPTWLIYQLIYLTIACFLHVFIRDSGYSSDSYDNFLKYAFYAFITYVLFCDIQIILQYPMSYYIAEFNDAFVHALDDFGVMKQQFGYLLGFLLAYTLFVVRSRRVQIIALLILGFTGLGIRSFVLGLIGASLLFLVRSPKKILFTLVLGGACLYLLRDSFVSEIIYDTRFYSYYNAFDIVQQFPFGVGLGGYPEYTEVFNRNLFADFYSSEAILDYIPIAPESDIVHVFGSLGLVLGILHFIIIGRILWHGYNLQQYATPIEKAILFFFCFMTFFGISEDSMFSIYYWIFFGLASGVASKLLMTHQKSHRAIR